MGDMADLLLDQTIDEWGEGGCWHGPGPRSKGLRCRQCGKRDLNWRMIAGVWTMFDGDKVHICSGYEPPIEVLKEVAKEVLEKTRKDALWRLQDKAKKRGGLLRLLPILPDEQLIELYACFVRDDQTIKDDDTRWHTIDYRKEIAILKGEILKRMT